MNEKIGNNNNTKKLYAYLVEFETPDQLLDSARKMREYGFKNWESYSPIPVHGLDKVSGIKNPLLAYFTFVSGVVGAFLGTLMQWWMNSVDFPYQVSGKPIFSLPANIPVIFEMTILFAAFGAVIGMMHFNKMPTYYHPLHSSKKFLRATSDRFFISLDASDPKFNESETVSFLESLNGISMEKIEDE